MFHLYQVHQWMVQTTRKHTMINRSVNFSLTQLYYTNNLTELIYMFWLTGSHLQALT
jgi:hypothetical protein